MSGITSLQPMSSDTETATKNNVSNVNKYGLSYDDAQGVARNEIDGTSVVVDSTNTPYTLSGHEKLIKIDTTTGTPGNREVKTPASGGSSVNPGHKFIFIRMTAGSTITIDDNGNTFDGSAGDLTLGTSAYDGYELTYLDDDDYKAVTI